MKIYFVEEIIDLSLLMLSGGRVVDLHLFDSDSIAAHFALFLLQCERKAYTFNTAK